MISNITSEVGLVGSSGQSCDSEIKVKDALIGLTSFWAKEIGGFNIRVVGVHQELMQRQD